MQHLHRNRSRVSVGVTVEVRVRIGLGFADVSYTASVEVMEFMSSASLSSGGTRKSKSLSRRAGRREEQVIERVYVCKYEECVSMEMCTCVRICATTCTQGVIQSKACSWVPDMTSLSLSLRVDLPLSRCYHGRTPPCLCLALGSTCH